MIMLMDFFIYTDSLYQIRVYNEIDFKVDFDHHQF